MRFGQSKGNNNYIKDENLAPTATVVPQVQTPAPAVEKQDEPLDLNSTAFSLTRYPEGGYALVEVKFNPITMQAKVVEIKKVSDSREEGEYYFRVRVGQHFAEQESKS